MADGDFLNAYLGGATATPSMTTGAAVAPMASPVVSTRAQSPASLTQSPNNSLPKRRPGEEEMAYWQRARDRIFANGGSMVDLANAMEAAGYKLPADVYVANAPTPTSPPPQNPASRVGTSVTQRPDSHPSALGSFGIGALDGLTFGFGDEALKAIVDLATGNGQKAEDAYRQYLRAAREDHPLISGAGEIGGGIANLLLGGEVLDAGAGALGLGSTAAKVGAWSSRLGTAGRVGLASAEGAIAGGATGAGEAEGGLSERAKGALLGAAAGAVLGGGGTALVKAVGAGPGVPALIGGGLGARVGGYEGAALGAGIGAVTGKVGQAAMRRVGETLEQVGNRLPPRWAQAVQALDPSAGSLAFQARRLVRGALDADNISPDQAIQNVEDLRAQGIPATTVDIGGPNTESLFREVASGLRSPDVQAYVDGVKQTQGAQADRILGTVFNELGLGAQNAYRAGETLLAGRYTLSKPYFDRAFQQQFTPTPEFQELMRSEPLAQQAWELGRAKAIREDAAGRGNGTAVPSLDILVPEPKPFDLTPQQKADLLKQAAGDMQKFKQLAAQLAPPPEPASIQNPTLPVRGFQYMKEQLDKIVNQQGTLSNPGQPVASRRTGSAIQAVVSAMRDDIAQQVPDYGTALSIYSDHSSLMDALSQGKGGTGANRLQLQTDVGTNRPIRAIPGRPGPRFVQKSPEVISQELQRLPSDAHREQYTIGALQDLAEALNQARSKNPDVVRALFGRNLDAINQSPMAQRLMALFDDPTAAQHIIDSIRGEAMVSGKSGVVAKTLASPRSQQLQRTEAAIPIPPLGFRAGPISTLIRMVSAQNRQEYTSALSNELSALGMRGLNGHDELIAFLNTLRNINQPHSIAPATLAGSFAARQVVQ